MDSLQADTLNADKRRQRRRSSSSDDHTDRVSPKKPKRSFVDDFHLQTTSDFPLGVGSGKADHRETGGLTFGGFQTEEDLRVRSHQQQQKKTQLRSLYEETKNELKEIGLELGILDDSDKRLRDNKELLDDCVSMHTDIEVSFDDLEFEGKTRDRSASLYGGGQKSRKMRKITQERIKNIVTSNPRDNSDAVSQGSAQSKSSATSRASSFKSRGFGSLIKNEEDENQLEKFFQADRHYMVLTNAGKPVFTLNGDIYNLSPIFATLYAIVSKAQTYQFKEESSSAEQVFEFENPYNARPQDTEMDHLTAMDMVEDDESGNAKIKAIVSHADHYKFVFLTKGNCLIYIALSRQRGESISFLKKQLEMIHLQLISISTKQVIRMLNDNPSFDLMQEMWNGLPLLKRMSQGVNKNIATVLQMFQPLRMDKQTQEHVEFAVKVTRPPAESFYFGLIVANQTVVGIFKSKPSITVRPADIIVLLTFLTEHAGRLKKRAPCFFNMCVPSLTENYKMSVFFHTSNRQAQGFGLRVAIVTEEASAKLVDKFEVMAEKFFKQLNLELTINRIKALEERMFERQRLREIQYMIVCNTKLEQYSSFNCPDHNSADLADQTESNLSLSARHYLQALRQFERLFQMYKTGKNKRGTVFVQFKMPLETFGLMASKGIIVMACVAHNRTSKSVYEVLQERLEAATDEGSRLFLHRYL